MLLTQKMQAPTKEKSNNQPKNASQRTKKCKSSNQKMQIPIKEKSNNVQRKCKQSTEECKSTYKENANHRPNKSKLSIKKNANYRRKCRSGKIQTKIFFFKLQPSFSCPWIIFMFVK